MNSIHEELMFATATSKSLANQLQTAHSRAAQAGQNVVATLLLGHLRRARELETDIAAFAEAYAHDYRNSQ